MRERDIGYSPEAENKPDFMLDQHPLSARVKDFAYKAYHKGYLGLKELANPEQIAAKFRVFVTAMHEVGHAKIVRSLGWKVTRISVIREGNVLGVTQFVPRVNSIQELNWGMVAVSQGGEVGQNLADSVGDRGCGSDMAQSDFNAESLKHNSQYLDPSSAKSFGRSTAAFNRSAMEEEALYLMYVGEKAA